MRSFHEQATAIVDEYEAGDMSAGGLVCAIEHALEEAASSSTGQRDELREVVTDVLRAVARSGQVRRISAAGGFNASIEWQMESP